MMEYIFAVAVALHIAVAMTPEDSEKGVGRSAREFILPETDGDREAAGVQFTWPKNRLRIRLRLNFDSMTCLNYLLLDFFQYRKSQADSQAVFQAVFSPLDPTPA